MEHGHDDLSRTASLLLMNVGRNATSIVDDGDRIVHVDDNLDRVAKTR